MTLSQIKTYTIGVLKQWFGNKNTLDKLSESENGNLVYNGTEIKDNSEQVETIATKIDGIKRYSKYVNAEPDSCFVKLIEDYSPVEGEYLPFQKVSGSLEVNNGKIIVKPNQRVHLSLSLSYSDSTNEVFPDIAFSFKDYTNDVVIHAIPEFDFINFCQYTNNTNSPCEIGIYVEKINTNDILNNMTTLTVQEITKIVVDPVEYINESKGLEDTPVGHIIAHMGMLAPKHYLICDGTEYHVADYPYLVEHIEHHFGAVNYFGGDGVTTFCVPDLRGEFLRGTGTANRDSGSGAEVGMHQDATTFAMPGGGSYSGFYKDENNPDESPSNYVTNIDKSYGTTTKARLSSTTYTSGGDMSYKYSSRPTNTSVLYCIKYEPTHYMVNNITNYVMPTMYSMEEKIIGCWIDGRPLYQKTYVVDTISKASSSSTKIIDADFTIDKYTIIDTNGCFLNSTKETLVLFPFSNTGAYCTVICSSNGLGIAHENSTAWHDLKMTIRYTKASDEENSFSIDMVNLTT